jgi:eukaryotic-like serine/threonine-protein kinase
MEVGGFFLETQTGTGSDGTAYRARTADGSQAVEVRILSFAHADRTRWPVLCKRLRLVAMLDHPGVLPLLALELEKNPPWVALPRDDIPGFAWASTRPVDAAQASAAAERLLGALAEAHRLGLVHGQLGPLHLVGPAISDLRIDFTGIEAHNAAVVPQVAELIASCRPPENLPDKPGDVFSLGALIYFLTTGHVFPGKMDPAHRKAAAPEMADLLALVETLLAADPGERPTARAAIEKLAPRPTAVASTPVVGVDPTGDLARTIVAPPAAETASVHRPTMPERLGRFRLLEKLGQGSMGTVYRAEDPIDGSVRAIKVLRPDLTSRPDSLRRFYKEARLLAEVNNPYVTNLLEVNGDGGVYYLVMEFVAGQSLSALLGKHDRLEEAQALPIMIDVARALVNAHERGIVHRDIKPENILLSVGWVESSEPTNTTPPTLRTACKHDIMPGTGQVQESPVARHRSWPRLLSVPIATKKLKVPTMSRARKSAARAAVGLSSPKTSRSQPGARPRLPPPKPTKTTKPPAIPTASVLSKSKRAVPTAPTRWKRKMPLFACSAATTP